MIFLRKRYFNELMECLEMLTGRVENLNICVSKMAEVMGVDHLISEILGDDGA